MKDKVISIVVNLDTRKGIFDETTSAEVMLKGARSIDFLTDGIRNKIKFFEGFEKEVILFVDKHEPIPPTTMLEMVNLSDALIVNKHREYFNHNDYFPKFNDINYLQALFNARGAYIAHFDADTAAFINDKNVISDWLQALDSCKYDYISYPSHWSPVAVDDPDFTDYMWASTRFFICRRDTLRFDEILRCLQDSVYLYEKYPANRHCPWLEHILGLMSKREKVFYPKIEEHRYLLFSWNGYRKGLLADMNSWDYERVKSFVMSRGINYPNDLDGR